MTLPFSTQIRASRQGISVSDAGSYKGTWEFTKDGLKRVILTLSNPEVFIDGIFWLAKGSPTPEDALPTFDNWLDAAAPLALSTPDASDLLPPPFVIAFKTLTFTHAFVFHKPDPSASSTGSAPAKPTMTDISTATLGAVEFTYAPNTALLPDAASPSGKGTTAEPPTVYELLLAKPGGPFDLRSFWHDLPLVWRRHARSPAIQSLPMTQVKSPADYPSASRQLFPFELPLGDGLGKSKLMAPGDWRFTLDGPARWPTLAAGIQVEPAVTTKDFDGLALVSLGLPGLVFEPKKGDALFAVADDSDKILAAQFRHEVALIDEVNALAMVPRDDAPHAPADNPPPAPPALERAGYKSFWTHLADLAFFATAEARDALVASGGKTFVEGLIEPFQWQVAASMTSAPYPGTIKFTDPNGKSVRLSGTSADALRGIEGPFRRLSASPSLIEQTDAQSAEYNVTGESMAAVLEKSGRIRDQRGLYREPTQVLTTAKSRWLFTRVALADDVGPAATPVRLWTAMQPIALSLPSGDSWNFWVRDLPAVESGATSRFDRGNSHSTQRRGENNPAAITRRLHSLAGL